MFKRQDRIKANFQEKCKVIIHLLKTCKGNFFDELSDNWICKIILLLNS